MRYPALLVLCLAVPAFSQAVSGLSDPDPRVRRKTVASLGADALPEVMRALARGDALGRENAARVLGRLGRCEAAPALAEALGDADPYVQGQATLALARLGPCAVPALAKALESGNPVVRKGAASALGRLGVAAGPAVPGLARALASKDGAERQGAAIALGETGKAAAPAVPALREALGDADEDVRWAAAWALDRLGAAPCPDPEATLRSLTPELMKELKVPGVAIAVVRDRKLAWGRAFGVAEAPSGPAVDRDTVFEACSMSKPVFAYLVLKLAGRGLLDLDRPLCAYLDEGGLPSQDERKLITARMVLSHTSGLPNWRKDGEEREGPAPVRFTPGARFSYSGEGMYLLQRVVEHLADEPLETLAERMIFRPLGMARTSYVWTPALALAAGHKLDGTFNTRTRYLHANAAYTLYTTADDYARFLVACMDPAASVMRVPQVKLDGRDPIERPGSARGRSAVWCLGWSANVTAAGTIYHHSGSNGSGFRCFSQFDPVRGTGLVIMTNGLGGGELWTRLVSRTGDF
jgi:CubicO group peptidase (beta-lactamase class C family)